jgi:hypothetical protein
MPRKNLISAIHEAAVLLYISVTARIAKWEKTVRSAGYSPTLWFARREVWETPSTEDSEERPHPEQHLAALQIFAWMFTASSRRAWVHLAAEMQAGKSGVANALIRLILQNADKLSILPASIFLLTGMADDAWKKQTKDRVPTEVRSNVHHSGGLNKVKIQLTKLAAKDGLRNVLIILDESQVASSASNRPNSLIYKTVRELVPVEQWVERNIRFLTISATDPAKVMSMESCEIPCRTVRLLTTDQYQSVESLNKAGRIRSLEEFGDIGSVPAVAELKRVVATYTTPLWHILRPRTGKTAEVEAKLLKEFPGARVVSWDSKTRPAAESDNDSGSESSNTLADINTLLSTPPAIHSFVLLKNMFYAAKTLKDEHVGVLWDRLGGNVGGDNARLQSLLGRACGYGKSSQTVVYTSSETVTRYLSFWKSLCQSSDADTVTHEHNAVSLHRGMPGVVAVATEGGATKVAPMLNSANPSASSAANAVASSAGRAKTNPDEYAVEWREFNTFEGAKSYASRVRMPKTDAAGYLLSSTTGAAARLSYGDVKGMQGGKKTAGFANPNSLAVGKSTFTMYACYRDLDNLASVVFVVGKLTRMSGSPEPRRDGGGGP